MNKERVLQIAETQETSLQKIELAPVAILEEEIANIGRIMVRRAGGLNYTNAVIADFEFQPYFQINMGRRDLMCAIEYKPNPSRTLCSSVREWPGPRGDYWVIVAELAGLKLAGPPTNTADRDKIPESKAGTVKPTPLAVTK